MKKLTKIIAMLLCIVVLTSPLTSCDQMLETILDRLFPSADPQPEEEEKHTHTWGDWEISTVPGCETAGERERLCSGCGEIKSETISATGHEIYEDDDRCRSCDKPRLAAPQNVSISGDKISWDRVSNAESYTVTINGDYTIITKNRFAYVRDAKDERGKSISTYGEIIVTVRADSVKNFIYSKMSEEALSYYVPTKEDDDNLASLGIGHSYNLIENDIYSVEDISQNSVLDINKLLGLGNYRLTEVNDDSIKSYSYTSNSEKYSKAEVKIGFGAEINYGVGNVKASVSGAAEGAMASHKYNHVYVVNGIKMHQQYLISGVNDNDTLRQCLSSAFINDLNAVKKGEKTIEELYSKYGTHVIIGVITGGYYNAQYIVSTDSKTVSEATEQKFSISTDNDIFNVVKLGLELNTSQTEDNSEDWKNTKTNFSISYAGSKNAITIDASNEQNFEQSVTNFFAGVEDNAIPFSIPKNGTISLVDVIKSMGEDYYDLANEFADCVTKHCISEFIKEINRQTDEYYRFDGLFTAKEGGEKIVDENGVILVDISSINVDTLYPQWTRFKAVEVTFDPNGGTMETENRTKIVDLDSTYGGLPTPTRTDHVFLGWKLGDTIITTKTSVTTATDHTLTAQWLRVKGSHSWNEDHLKVSASNYWYVSLSGHWLDRDALIRNGYETITITVTVTASGKTGTIWNDEPYIKICTLNEMQLASKSISTFDDEDWQTQTCTFIINLSDVSADGLFRVEFHNSGLSPYFIKSYTIAVEVNN